MKEFNLIFVSQILVIIFGLGIIFGSFIGVPVYYTKIVRVLPEQIYPEIVIRKAMKWNGVYVATRDENGEWLFIDRYGKPCKLFFKEAK